MTKSPKRIEWEARLQDWKDSGLSKAEWCRDNGYKEHQMYYWIQRIYKPEVKPKLKVDFLPVNISDETEKDNEPLGSVFIHIDRMSVEVRPNTDINLLSKVLHVLQS